MAVAVANPDKKKYNKMEPVLQYINKNFITVNDDETKKANPILKHVIDTITGAMKVRSKLFEALFTDILYGGSFFDGLKVGKPEEFDIDLRLVLPKLLETTIEISDQPGFVRIQMKGWANFEKNVKEYDKYKGLEKFKDDKNYLLVNEVMKWMESTVNHALNSFQQSGKKYLIPYNGKDIEVALKKSGPALTTLITYGNIYMDVDLVAVFKLTQDQWPSKPFKACPDKIPKKDFMIVPKTPKGDIGYKDRYWRMSFQEQEKVIITGLNTCKTALRMIKKLRDTQNHNLISSYFIKTVFLHEIDKQKPEFWNSSLNFVFMHMLKTYKTYLDERKISYYWNTRNNLLEHIDKIVTDNFKYFLERVIKNVDKNIDDNPLVIADYLSTTEEQAELKKVNFQFSSKKTKEPNINSSINVNNVDIIDVTETTDLICLMDNSISINEKPSFSNVALLTETPNNVVVEVDSSDKIISLLQSLQSSMRIIESDLKYTMKKITHLEYSIQELKTDNVEFKNILQQNQNYGFTSDTLALQLQLKKETENQSVRIETLNDKFDSLSETVDLLQTNNETLKNGLKSFVFQT